MLRSLPSKFGPSKERDDGPNRAIWDTRAVRDALARGDLGAVVRAVRRANNITLAELAARSNYSISTLSRLERGKQSLRDTHVLRSLAAALQFPPELLGVADPPRLPMHPLHPPAIVGLTRGPDEETEPMRRRTLLTGLAGTVTVLGVAPSSGVAQASDPLHQLERALLATPTTGVPVHLRQLDQQVTAARSMFDHGHYAALANGLPRLLSTATATHSSGTTNDIAATSALLARAYVVAAQLSVKFSHDQLAWTTADRAMQAAQVSNDPLIRAQARRSWAIVLRRTGHTDTAAQLILDTAASLQAQPHRDVNNLATFAALLSTAAYTAATSGDRDGARTLIDEAAHAAAQVEHNHPGAVAGFGTGSVVLYQVSIARVLGDAGTAIDTARRIDPASIRSAETRARYWSDVARAFHQWGKFEQCYGALRAAEHAAPDEVRYRKPIQQITFDLLQDPHSAALPGLRSFADRTGTRAP
ncbi:helix-turn-helix domain-containing protein [Nocardia harenae]|uniref:helix-turn-helix domain-containing protein n=1 Tax=Nocardia harenae TaxID=358707 RepID=UPI0009FECC1F|nr:helix-turn-helix domain-containing protein [Nocardia harenae]